MLLWTARRKVLCYIQHDRAIPATTPAFTPTTTRIPRFVGVLGGCHRDHSASLAQHHRIECDAFVSLSEAEIPWRTHLRVKFDRGHGHRTSDMTCIKELETCSRQTRCALLALLMFHTLIQTIMSRRHYSQTTHFRRNSALKLLTYHARNTQASHASPL